jgi:hypothetical protein
VRFYRGYSYSRILYERFTEPVHLNIAAAFVKVFGSFRAKVAFDVTPRRSYAFGMLKAADLARAAGLKKVTVVEFGVASGDGLLAMCRFGEAATRCTGVQFNIVGFDTGTGLPPPADYRDHPDLWIAGDYPMPDRNALLKSLPPNAKIIFGPIAETAPQFIESLSAECPLGFVAIDVDYYSSAVDCLKVFAHSDPNRYMHLTLTYFDDIMDESCNSWCGELLAIREFNQTHELRKLEVDRTLKNRRVFKNAAWLDQIYFLHVLDHPMMQPHQSRRASAIQVANTQLGIGRIDPTTGTGAEN